MTVLLLLHEADEFGPFMHLEDFLPRLLRFLAGLHSAVDEHEVIAAVLVADYWVVSFPSSCLQYLFRGLINELKLHASFFLLL